MTSAAKPARMADLDSDLIAAAALALLEEKGLSGFTMRGVAEALGVTPMALYHHVRDKAALAALVVDAASRERPLPPPTGDWKQDLEVMARWAREAMLAGPEMARLRKAYQVWTPSLLQFTERWMSLWQQSGLPLQAAARAAAVSSMAIVGLIEQELAFAEMPPPDPSLLTLLPNTRLAFATTPDREAEFDIVVRSLIEGLCGRLGA